ncbi:cuticle protein 21-like [Homarus americanus]|uniref:cuticle protein 21-like n=1 Tax=Homarus americanus TaxID=6706 RepID=UPI001C438311|nr:cuticle protein 21-like [Homarus americanus]
MLLFLFLIVLGVATAPHSRETYSYVAPRTYSAESFESGEAKDNFDWAVKDEYVGDVFGHQETRDGDNTQGSYYMQLPDGRLQTVTYYVDGDSGYVADVKYESEAHYPDSHETREYARPRPSYFSQESEESHEAPVYAPPKPRSYHGSNE